MFKKRLQDLGQAKEVETKTTEDVCVWPKEENITLKADLVEAYTESKRNFDKV